MPAPIADGAPQPRPATHPSYSPREPYPGADFRERRGAASAIPDPLLADEVTLRPPFPGTEGINAAEVFGVPGYQAPRLRTDPMAMAALVAGLASPVPGVGVLAVILGWIAVRRLRHGYGNGLSMAWFGVVVGATATVCWLWLWWMVAVVTK